MKDAILKEKIVEILTKEYSGGDEKSLKYDNVVAAKILSLISQDREEQENTPVSKHLWDSVEKEVYRELAGKIEEMKGELTMKWDSDKYQSWAFDKVLSLIKPHTPPNAED